MPILQIPQSGLSLDSSGGPTRPDFAPVDIFGLSLSDNVIEDMIKCVRSRKSVQLSLGKDPVSHVFSSVRWTIELNYCGGAIVKCP
jgi:RNA polymerase II elongation factor ELL